MTTTLTPLAARFTRIAALINDNNLPDAAINVSNDGNIVGVSMPDTSLAEGSARRWAQALDLIVGEQPHEMPDGTASTLYTASGTQDGVFYIVQANVPVRAAVAS